MFAKRAYGLFQELISTPKDAIPPYNDDAFRDVVDEIRMHHERLAAIYHEAQQRRAEGMGQPSSSEAAEDDGGWTGTPAEATEMVVHHASILRNKRLLFAYVKERLDRLQDLRWVRRTLPQALRQNLSPLEVQYFQSYDQLLNKYMRSGRLGVGLDLTADSDPPDDPFVQVRVLRDYGEVVFSSGKVSLQRGKSHWIPRDEAHPLVMDGILEFVGGAKA